MTDGHDWGETLDDLDSRRQVARAMGGPEKVEVRADAGRLDARSRIDALLDAGTFAEIGTLAGGGAPADALVAGVGAIDGRPVAVGAEDFTTMGGSIGPAASRKRWRIADIARRERVPLIMLLEGAGHRPPMPGDPGGGGPGDLQAQGRLSGLVPMVCGVMGSSAGHGAITAPLCDWSVMTGDAAIFTAGPPVVLASLSEEITKQELGGPAVAVASGVVHNVAADDASLLADVRTYLSFFGSSAWERPPWVDTGDLEPRRVEEMLEIVPRDANQAYDMRHAVSSVVDGGGFFQIQPDFGPSVVCALARIGGHAVGVVANQPAVIAGSIDVDAADKAAHFIQVCDSFHLPLVFLADNPGVLAGSVSERAGILRAGARMFTAQTRARTVKLHVTIRKAYGFGSCVMAMNGYDEQTLSYGFPGATLGAMGAQGAGNAVGADDETRAALRQAELESSYRSAAGLGFDELIDPRDLRTALLTGLDLSARRRAGVAEPVARVGITP
ncbi:MAG: acetyl-CoA carboxylase carboxyltransferase subunit [Acidimicrobiales bacterium]|nr:MAG: acetyl-CoA carboxylase carboxyltransferase subunit [Acidimicrobiales bacterium]